MTISRRKLIGAATLAAGSAIWPGRVVAQSADAVTIAWPSDVPSWDPNQRFVPDGQSIFKAVFDQPLSQDPALKLIPHVVSRWQLSDDALSMKIELRDDVLFHDGSRLTADDFRFTFLERVKITPGLDIANSWRKIEDIEVWSSTNAIMRFSSPAPTAPQWLSFLGSYIVPRKVLEAIGAPAFAQKPVGSGPYKMVEWEQNARIVLERNDAYWGPKPAIRRVTIQVVKDASARVAASNPARSTSPSACRSVTRCGCRPIPRSPPCCSR